MNNPSSVFLSACWFLLASNSPVANELAIVIDDLGYSYQAGKRAIDLPGQITLAILPFAPNTRALAKYAKEKNKEVIIHLPMQAEQDEVNVSEKVVLRQHMSSIQFKVILDASSNNLSNAREYRITRVAYLLKNEYLCASLCRYWHKVISTFWTQKLAVNRSQQK